MVKTKWLAILSAYPFGLVVFSFKSEKILNGMGIDRNIARNHTQLAFFFLNFQFFLMGPRCKLQNSFQNYFKNKFILYLQPKYISSLFLYASLLLHHLYFCIYSRTTSEQKMHPKS
jgi:hypothetical protein